MSATDSGITIPERRAIAPQHPLTVTLEARQWEQVLRLLDVVPAPHHITHPLIVGIDQQCMAADERDNVTRIHESGRP
jgi:hypothetical protein